MTSSLDPARPYGVSPPISNMLPTPEELRFTEDLIAELRKNNNFEATEDTERRYKVLAHFQMVAEEFVRQVSRQKGISPSAVPTVGGKISAFGSYRLGVYGPGSDIDVLMVGPKHVYHEDFFRQFPSTLEEMSPAGVIEKMNPLPDAYVPILALEYSGISIDIAFTRLPLSSVPRSLNLRDKLLLRDMNDKEARSINGTQVTEEIFTLMPQIKSFRVALRAIKLWAQRRAIYGKVMGFPGGVAWALLAARICQLYPMACGATIVAKFFVVMMNWQWPRPVLLKDIETGPLNVRVWNPLLFPMDRQHLMPVITPAYPATCVTHTVTQSSKAIIQRELARGAEIVDEIVLGKRTWQSLFEKQTFFTRDYKNYLSIVAATRAKDEQVKWSGLVRAKVRRLALDITVANTGVKLARLFTNGFDRVHCCKNEEEVAKVFQGDLQFQLDQEKDERKDGSTEESENVGSTKEEEKSMMVYTTTFYIGLDLDRTVGKSLDLSIPVADFKRHCTGWYPSNPDLKSLRTIHTRNYDLPLDVFEPGETRPIKAKVKTKAKMAEASIDPLHGVKSPKQPTA